EVLQALHGRKSVRVFLEKPIPAAEKVAILEAACAAPTAGNQQLYTILDITDQSLKDRLAVSCDHQPFIGKAAMVLVFCADCRKWYDAYQSVGCTPRAPGAGDLMLAVDDALIAAQNAVTAAESLGIGSCYIGDIMEGYETHKALLRLPRYVFPAAMLVFGYPTEQQKERPKPPRCDLAQIVFENAYPVRSAEDFPKLFRHEPGAADYEGWLKAFCQRKYDSDFSREMTQSVGEYLKEFE
ncbi:MAG: nitroreductase family protein, partial [Oscillospiraceae bacterium]